MVWTVNTRWTHTNWWKLRGGGVGGPVDFHGPAGKPGSGQGPTPEARIAMLETRVADLEGLMAGLGEVIAMNKSGHRVEISACELTLRARHSLTLDAPHISDGRAGGSGLPLGKR